MKDLNINHAAVWVSVVVLSILGFLWYGPIFGESWMGMVGLTMEAAEANPPGAGTWVTNFIATIIPVYVMAYLYSKLGVSSLVEGAIWGLIIGFSFVHLSDMTGNMFAQRPYGLAWITGGYSMVSLAIAGAILGAWRPKEK